jgi:hypothetical protein
LKKKNMSQHKLSIAHRKARELLSLCTKKIMESLNAKPQLKQYEAPCRLLRTVNHFAKSNRPLSDLPVLTDLQMASGLEMGRTVQTRGSQTFLVQASLNLKNFSCASPKYSFRKPSN